MTKLDTGLSRRSFLSTAGGVTLGLGIAGARPPVIAADATLPKLPWDGFYPAEGLDPALVRQAAYCLYYLEGGCGHGSAQAIIDALAARSAR